MAELTLTVESTIGFEALGWGAKVMICNPTNHEYFKVETSAPWYCEAEEMPKWRYKLFELLEMRQADYRENINKGIEYFMVSDFSKPANQVIKDKITAVMNGQVLTDILSTKEGSGASVRFKTND